MGNFGEVFRDLRKRSGLTQSDLATKLSLSRSSVGMYETGEREPDFETLETIADFFNVDMNYLLGKENEPQQGYYLNDDAAKMAQEIYENPNLRILFDASRNVSTDDLQFVVDMMKRLKGDDD